MPVTVTPTPGKFGTNKDRFATKSKDLIKDDRNYFGKRIMHSSFQSIPANVIPYGNGFVNGAIRAYQQDLHLELRPDDVWLSIVTQFSYYVVGHAEELRSKFVAHEDKKDLLFISEEPFHLLDVPHMARGFAAIIKEHLTNDHIRDWIIPDFSTTTDNDIAISSLAMMATMKKYFNFYASSACGLPSVTLLGEVSDWEKIVDRVSQLPQYGSEPERWSQILKPILTRFVDTFNNPDSQTTKEFWDEICYAERSSGSGASNTFSGWITAFAYWDTEGRLNEASPWDKRGKTILTIDGVEYPVIKQGKVTSGVVEVPLTFLALEQGIEYDTTIVAGSMGVVMREHEEQGQVVTPYSGWCMVENGRKPLNPDTVTQVLASANK